MSTQGGDAQDTKINIPYQSIQDGGRRTGLTQQIREADIIQLRQERFSFVYAHILLFCTVADVVCIFKYDACHNDCQSWLISLIVLSVFLSINWLVAVAGCLWYCCDGFRCCIDACSGYLGMWMSVLRK